MTALEWRTERGEIHLQLPGEACTTCPQIHRLSEAHSRRICPGVAHTWPTRPCVLCGLDWRVPGVVLSAPVQAVAQPARDGTGVLSAEPVYTDQFRPASRCLYCEVLQSHPLDLARHRVRDH